MMRGGKVKKTVLAVLSAGVLLCGCKEERAPMQQLPPEHTTAKTSSTYTGTTVEFIYVSTSVTPRRPTNALEMPDFPEIDGDPFDDSFYGLFTEGAGEQAEVSFPKISSINIPNADIPDIADNFSETMPPYETADVRFTESSETAVTEAPDETADTAAETVTVGSFASETNPSERTERASVPSETPYETDTASVTFSSAKSFDIKEYMPSQNDYPEFSSFDINGLFEP